MRPIQGSPGLRARLLAGVCLVLVLPVSALELVRSTLDGGGGLSSGGAFELHGTIGQFDPGLSSGGDFELKGGFWAGGDASTATPDQETPRFTRLFDPVPNPFNPKATLAFELAEPGKVTVRVFDVTGRRLRALADEAMPAGRYDLTWDGRDDAGAELASGVYFIQMRAGRYAGVRKAVLVR